MTTTKRTYQVLKTVVVEIIKDTTAERFRVYVDRSHYGTFYTLEEAQDFVEKHIEYNNGKELFDENTSL